MSISWQAHEGEVINGRYPLLQLLQSNDDSAIFSTELGEERTPALVHLVHANETRAAHYLSRWRQVASLSHPNLLRIHDFDDASAEIGPGLYLVSEAPDDALARILTERPLTIEELRQVAEAISSGLDALHQKGLVHGDLHPAAVFAVGDQIRISADGIVQHESASAAEDISNFGLLLVACVHQSVPDRAELPGVIAGLPEPFRQIVDRTLDADPQKRWTAARIGSVLRGEMPARLEGIPRTPIRLPGGNKTVQYAGVTALAVLALLIGIEKLRTPKETPPDATAVAQLKPSPTASVPAPAVTTPAVRQAAPPRRQSPKPKPEGTRSRITIPITKPGTDTTPPVPGNRSGDHLVVVATYNRLPDAEKRARAISARWPKFPATVYAPHQPNPPYFVIIGANLSKESATQLQRRARSSGLPHDTYVTK